MSDTVTQEQLEQACREWMKRLRLADWRVTVRWQGWVSMSVLGRSGEVHWNLQQKSATIYILPPGQRCDDSPSMTPGDWEQTLCHELLHLHFAPFDDSGGEHETAQEQALNAMAEALVAAVREGRQESDRDWPGWARDIATERDDANRALEMERAAHRATAARLKQACEAAVTLHCNEGVGCMNPE